LLYAGECELRSDGLILPHPRMTARRFVLAPLADIRPGLMLPGQTETIRQLLAKLPPGDSAVPVQAEW
jgi:2-amino-4-hydroxy-6-hydroxymethyldihydropteridine diphosphokinase